MLDVNRFLTKVPGVNGVFLMKNNRIVQSTFKKDVDILLKDLSLITEALKEKYGTVQKISMSGDRNLFFFYHKNMILGIEGDRTISLPLLNIQARVFFKKIDESNQ
ncbi:MAG: hypothetical protein HXS46_19800 [Theionarchaea archaeon]|nr:MAG: hypothetical protein AYK18_00150 [Theionarchaea archaeon DG-70]MBU7012932.1 hypothetical protein [Theionarchaea archaeon]